MFICRCVLLLGIVTLIFMTGAAGGQSQSRISPGPDRELPSDKEVVKPSLEPQQEFPLKDSREQPVQAKDEQIRKPLKNKGVTKPKAKVSRSKKPGAGKPNSGSRPDELGPQESSDWWPAKPQPAPSAVFLPPLELRPEDTLEGDFKQNLDEFGDE